MERTNPRVLIPPGFVEELWNLGFFNEFMPASGTGDFDFSFSLWHPHSFIAGFTGGYGVVQKALDLLNIQSKDYFLADFKGRDPLKAQLLKFPVGLGIFINIFYFVVISGPGKKLFPFYAVGSGFGAVHNNFFHCHILLVLCSVSFSDGKQGISMVK